MKKNLFLSGTGALIAFLFSFSALAQTVPTAETAGGISQQEKERQKARILEEKIIKEKPMPAGSADEGILPRDAGPKTLINTITVEGATLLSPAEIQAVVAPFEGKELSLAAMQKVADLLTDEYRKKGYITSRAYIPPQTIADGILVIRVLEGKLGSLTIRGNQYFRTSTLEKKIGIEPTGYFDYSALQKSLVYINEHPDRMAKAVLVPGKLPGTTDVIIDIEDHFPFHVGFEYDNYASRYLEHNRYSLFVEHNNLLGFDDKLYVKGQRGENSILWLTSARYTFPVTKSFEIGAYAFHTKTKLVKELKDLEARGTASLGGIFFNTMLVNTADLDIRFNFGFDYKRIRNYLSGALNSRDDLRIVKGGFDIDSSDRWGRTVLTSELAIGIPNIMGGMKAKSDTASRAGAGSKFYKSTFNLFRLQPMPWESYILLKNSLQFCNYNLVASEQFQIGGATSVRGYPPAEHSGDKGLYSAIEWSFPPYFISKERKLPFTNETIYDTLRLVAFYDWGTVRLNKTSSSEKERQTLRAAGFGIRLNIRDNLSFRVEVGYPLGKTPSDENHAHPWVELIYRY